MSKPMILDAPRKEIIHYNWGNTDKIMKVIMKVVNKDHLHKQVEKFAKRYKGVNDQDQKEKLFDLWLWVRQNIPYVADPVGVQDIKHPARTYEDAINGKGSDCKSMTVFVRFVLYNIGVPHHIEFASYHTSGRIQHVFAVAEIGGKEVPVDTVHDKFDSRVKATRTKKIYPENMTMIREIAGISGSKKLPKRQHVPFSTMTDGELSLYLTARELELVEAINRQNGFTKEADTQAEAQHHLKSILNSGLHSGFGSSKSSLINNFVEAAKRRELPAMIAGVFNGIYGEFDPTTQQIDYCETISTNYANLVFSSQGITPGHFAVLPNGDSWYDIYDEKKRDCLDEKEMENVVNAHLFDAGPYFLYAQWGEDSGYNTSIVVKELNQRSWVAKASQVTGLSYDNIMGIVRTGSIEAYGTSEVSNYIGTPESVKEGLSPVIYNNGVNLGIIEIIAIVTAVVNLAVKVVGFINGFEEKSKSQQAFDSIPVPNSPNMLMSDTDFPIPDGTDPNGGSNSGNNNSNGSGFKFDTKTATLLVGGMLLLNSNNSK